MSWWVGRSEEGLDDAATGAPEGEALSAGAGGLEGVESVEEVPLLSDAGAGVLSPAASLLHVADVSTSGWGGVVVVVVVV
jgi:hypothetical protein